MFMLASLNFSQIMKHWVSIKPTLPTLYAENTLFFYSLKNTVYQKSQKIGKH